MNYPFVLYLGQITPPVKWVKGLLHGTADVVIKHILVFTLIKPLKLEIIAWKEYTVQLESVPWLFYPYSLKMW